DEESRSLRENLDEETLAIYDLLKKDNLTKKDIETVKKVAKETLKKLKEEKLKIDRWRESNQISAQVKILIKECLLHLPENIYPNDEIDLKTMEIYQHIFSSYYGAGKSIYTI
ncbi:type I restriction endonuclease subunit R, partial [Pelagibacterales bacterium SAG-MED46]|nr:type I restriction endonuclease subunit R [Pelagibacterales bacterium SAG-MED46]